MTVRSGLVPWILGTVGGLALVVQTLMLRELMVSAWGNELVFGIGLSCWLAGVGLGAAMGTCAVRRGVSTTGGFRAGLLVLPWLGLAGTIWVRLLPVLSGTPIGVVPGFGSVLWVGGPAFLLAALPVGWTFPFGAALVRAPEAEGPSVIYAAEGFGALLAAVALAMLLLGHLHPGWILTVGTVPVMVAAAAWEGHSRWQIGFLVIMALVAAAAVQLGGPVADVRWRHTTIGHRTWERDTPYQHLALASLAGQTILLSNGKPAVTFPDPTRARITAGRLLAQKPGARSVLVLGMVPPDLVAELVGTGCRVQWVMLDHAAATPLVSALANPVRSGVSISFDDTRAWVRAYAASGQPGYDLVVLAGTTPVSLLQARLTTVDAMRQLSRVLTPGGVLASSVPATVNYRSGDTGKVAATELSAVGSVFRYLAVSPESPHWVFACNRAGVVTDDPNTVRTRLEKRGDRWWRVAQWVAATFPEERTRSMAAWVQGLPPMDHRDDRPLLVLRYARLLGWYSGSTISPLLATLERLPWIWVILPLMLAGLRLARPPGTFPQSPAGLTAVAGCGAMAVTLVLLTAFQVRVGTVYREVAMINGCFMAGLPLGALGMWKWRHQTGSHPMLPPLLGFLLLSVVLAWISPATRLPAIGFFFASLVDGLLTGAVFPAALEAAKPRERSGAVRAGTIDAADHLGAAVGALLTGAFIVPVLGFRTTLLLVAAMLGAVLPLSPDRGSGSGQQHRQGLH